MHSSAVLLSFWAIIGLITGLPLNINLGAYSPALVVGDGEISFGGKQDVTNLMNALEGAAVSSAAANANSATTTTTSNTNTNEVAAFQSSSAAAATGGEDQAQVTPEQQQAAQIAALQGMGKEIDPRVVPVVESVEKRDLSGFDRALTYAATALTTSPKIQLGTGAEGSGVGILQDAGSKAETAAASTQTTVKKRAEGVTPKMKTTVTTMFVRGGAVPASSKPRSLDDAASVAKRAPSPGLDGVNLNMAEGQVAELTFVETRAVGDGAEDDE